MKKSLIILIALITLLFTSCGIPNDVDKEIKDLIKDVPIPPRYNIDTGEQLTKYKITVKETEDSYNYSIASGELRTEYEILLQYDMPFYVLPGSDKYEAYRHYLTFYLTYYDRYGNEIKDTLLFSGIVQITNTFTLKGLRELSDNLTWEN